MSLVASALIALLVSTTAPHVSDKIFDTDRILGRQPSWRRRHCRSRLTVLIENRGGLNERHSHALNPTLSFLERHVKNRNVHRQEFTTLLCDM